MQKNIATPIRARMIQPNRYDTPRTAHINRFNPNARRHPNGAQRHEITKLQIFLLFPVKNLINSLYTPVTVIIAITVHECRYSLGKIDEDIAIIRTNIIKDAINQ